TYLIEVDGINGASGSLKLNYNLLVAPAIISQPKGLLVNQGASATFTVTANGNPLNYQWQFNSDDMLGETANSYTRASVQPAQAGSYRVVVNNSLGTASSSSAALFVR